MIHDEICMMYQMKRRWLIIFSKMVAKKFLFCFLKGKKDMKRILWTTSNFNLIRLFQWLFKKCVFFCGMKDMVLWSFYLFLDFDTFPPYSLCGAYLVPTILTDISSLFLKFLCVLLELFLVAPHDVSYALPSIATLYEGWINKLIMHMNINCIFEQIYAIFK